MKLSTTTDPVDEPSNDMTTAEPQEDLLEKLLDAHVAFDELAKLSDRTVRSVVRSRVQMEDLSSPGKTHLGKRRREDSDEDSDEANDEDQSSNVEAPVTERSSAKRMVCLYQQLRDVQQLFTEELEKFIDEAEASSRREEAPACAE